MGANLLLAYLPAATITKQRRHVLHRLVADLSDAEVNCEEIESLAEGCDARQMLHTHVDELPDQPGKYRDVLKMALPHMPYPLVFTGGASWGDSPSHVFDAFCSLGVLSPIYRQLRTWAVADEKLRRAGARRRQSA